MAKTIPDICDYDCPYADFPPADTAGICRTMSAVWCGKLKELVYKNTPCTWKQRGGGKTGRPARATRKKSTSQAAKSTARSGTRRKSTARKRR
jgi:hypothetical protein